MLKTGWVLGTIPVRKQFVDSGRLDDVARDDVGAEFTCFLEKKNSKVFVAGFIGDLLKTNGCAEAGRPCKTLVGFKDTHLRTYRRLRYRHRPHRSHGPAAGR